jgi:hypothetical protein
LKPNRPGSELAFRVNQTTQKVLIAIVKNDGNYGVKDIILDNCSIVDDTNWKCRKTNSLPESSPFHQVTDDAMIHGRYYHSLRGGGPPNFYTSSIKGLAFLAVYYGLMDLPTALHMTGYSAQALNGFCATATFDYLRSQETTFCR